MNTSHVHIFQDEDVKNIFPMLSSLQVPAAIVEPGFNEKREITGFNFIFVNDYASASFGIDSDKICGKKLTDLFSVNLNGNVFNDLSTVYKTGTPQTITLNKETPGSPVENLKINAAKFGDFIIINWIDVTFIQAQARTIMQLEKSNEELEQFAYVASHDLQEPIRMVISFTQLLQKRYADKLDADAQEFIKYAVDGAERMKELIDTLLEYSRVSTSKGRWKQFSVQAVVKNICDDFKEYLDESGTKIFYKDLPEVYSDESMFTRLLTNLVSNSIKYRKEENPWVKISAQKNNSEWIFSVEDNGIGMEEQYFDKIFILFKRLHGKSEYPGTGIGLAIVKRIIEKLGGRIWLESKINEGTTFHFTIPIKEF